MRLISLQWDWKSEACHGISEEELHCGAPLYLHDVLFLTRDVALQSAQGLSCEWILMQPWTQVIDYSLPGLTWHIRLRSGISHLPISGIMVHGRCYVSHCFYFFIIFLWIFVGWSLFFVFVFLVLDNNLSNQKSILTCLFSF